jgi:hypothetical protein
MKKKPNKVFTLIPGKEAVEALDDPEKLQAIYEQICEALGIEPEPEEAAAPSDDDEQDDCRRGGGAT